MAAKPEGGNALNSQLLAMIAEVVNEKVNKVEPDVYDIPSFCERHRIGKSHYFNMRRDGLGPREMRVGGRVLISKEAAADWRKAREVASNAEAAE